MKCLLVSLFCLLFSALSFGQYVTIQDADFVTYLQDTFPTCMEGDQMDTTCTEIVNATTVDCRYYAIDDLEGICYFDNLERLNASSNSLDNLPYLPQTQLHYLNVSNNYISSIDIFPENLDSLLIWANLSLSSIPELPLSLKFFWASYCYDLEIPFLHGGLEEV